MRTLTLDEFVTEKGLGPTIKLALMYKMRALEAKSITLQEGTDVVQVLNPFAGPR